MASIRVGDRAPEFTAVARNAQPVSLAEFRGKRVTYVIDKAGVVRHVFSALFSADRHVAESLEVVRRLVQESENQPFPHTIEENQS